MAAPFTAEQEKRIADIARKTLLATKRDTLERRADEAIAALDDLADIKSSLRKTVADLTSAIDEELAEPDAAAIAVH